jgi:hypothetical protein
MRRLGRAVRRPRERHLRRRERARAGAGPRAADPDRRAGAGFERGLARAAIDRTRVARGDFPALRGEVDTANADFSRARTIAEQQGLDECALLGRVDR